MIRIDTYDANNPLTDTALVIPLIQSQMETIGAPKSAEDISRALINAFKPGSRVVLFVGSATSRLPAAFAFGNIGAGLETGADYFWLNELFVDHSYRRQGYAGAMLSFIENWLKERDIKYIALVTGEDNSAAQNMYIKKGYEVDGIIWVDKEL